jgi:NADH-quinone oxidoreductase subunit H
LFALFFLAEYCNIVTFSYIIVLIFFQGWHSCLIVFWGKVLFLIMFIIVIRAILPRYKFIDVFSLCWKFFLPLMLFYSFLILIVVLLLVII